MEMIIITQCFKQIHTTLRLTAIATGGDYKIITTVQSILELLLCSYGLIVHLLKFIYLFLVVQGLHCCMCVGLSLWCLLLLQSTGFRVLRLQQL